MDLNTTDVIVEAADVFSLQAVEIQRSGNVIYPTSLSAADRAEYYKAYDPMTGLRIAGTLSGLFAMAVLYVVYKAKCRRPRLARHTSLADPSAPAEDIFWAPAPWETNETFWESSYAPEEMADPDSYSINKSTNRYYVDDSEMPSWKVYAKELFLYGGPGLFRSAGLKGSAPLPLTPQSSLDTGNFSCSSLRAKSLSGSVMGTLSIPCSQLHRPYASSGKVDAAHLQVPPESWTAVSATEILMAEMQRTSSCRKKALPTRSVSFRESETSRGSINSSVTTLSARKAGLPPRTSSLRGSRDYVRSHQTGAPVVRCASFSSYQRPNLDRKPGESSLGTSSVPQVPALHRENSFQSRTSSQDDSVSSTNRTILTHRIPLGKKLPERSSSLNEPPRAASQAGWRSAIRQMMRAKSTSGHSVRAKEKSKSQLRLELNLTPSAEVKDQAHLFEAVEHIDICVIQPTPAVSPCTSVKTLCSESMENSSPTHQVTVIDRRKRFAHQRAKGQTIDLGDDSSYDSIELQPQLTPPISLSVPKTIPPSSLLQIPSIHVASNLSLHRLPADPPTLQTKPKTYLEVPTLQVHLPDSRKSSPVTSPNPTRRQQRSYSVEKTSSTMSVNRPILSRQWSTMLGPSSSSNMSYEKLEQNDSF